jgi:hypothetical protein
MKSCRGRVWLGATRRERQMCPDHMLVSYRVRPIIYGVEVKWRRLKWVGSVLRMNNDGLPRQMMLGEQVATGESATLVLHC